MIPFLPLLVPALVQAPASDWDRARDVLVSTVEKKGGLGLLLSLDYAAEGHLTVRFLERQSADSGWDLSLQPLDPGPGAMQNPFVVNRAPDFTAFQARAIPVDVKIAPHTEQLSITLTSQAFKAKVWDVPLPRLGGPARVMILYLPKP